MISRFTANEVYLPDAWFLENAMRKSHDEERTISDQVSQGALSSFLRDRRLKAARPHLTGRVLDYGCGSGALADAVDATAYTGYDPDPESIARARTGHPAHTFVTESPLPSAGFDTVVLLAVLEHVSDPAAFLHDLGQHVAPGGRIVLTTPHPSLEWAHTAGARLGLFSHEAHEQHETLLDRPIIEHVAGDAGLTVDLYRRFLAGANQLAVLRKD